MSDLKQIEKLAEAVFYKRPVLKNILRRWDDLSLIEYAKNFNITKTTNKTRKEEFATAIADEISLIWGNEEALASKKSILANYFVLTGDHHGPLTHPFFIHSNLLAGLASESKDIFVLACSSVSLNNSSQPRGLMYHDAQGNFIRLNLLPGTERHSPVYSCRPYTIKDTTGLTSVLPQSILDVINDSKILKQKRYGTQISIINDQLWKMMFRNSKLPKIKYLELERITTKLIAEHHIDQNTIIHRLIFEPEIRNIFLKEFENIPGNFDSNRGTVLFWYFPKDKSSRVSLKINRDYLESDDKSIRVEIKPEAIKRLLLSGELIPNNLFNLLIVSAYYGVKCLGGFSQTTYLSIAEQKFNEIFQKTTNPDPDHTQTLCADLNIGFLQMTDNWVPASGLDLILYGREESWDNFVNACNNMTLRQAVYPTLPAFYQILYPLNERRQELADISQDYIIKALNLKNRIDPVAWI